MTFETLCSFAAAMAVFAAVPGPGVFAVMARSLSSGFSRTLPMMLGMLTGDLCYFVFSVVGLAMLAKTMGTLFLVVRYVGGLWLVWLGINAWMRRVDSGVSLQPQKATLKDAARGYLGGLCICLSNPKVIMFYLGFLPGFVDLEQMTIRDGFYIAFTLACVLFSVLGSYALVASRARVLFSSRRAVTGMNRVAGTVMIGAGAAVIARS